MPIRFRCAYCNQLMGISRRKAGTVVRCPSCSGQVVVPNPASEPTEKPQPAAQPELFERSNFDELFDDAAGGKRAPAKQAAAAAPRPTPDQPQAIGPPPVRRQEPVVQPVEEAPHAPEMAFDVEPVSLPPVAPAGETKPGIVLSPRVATLAIVGVILALALAFAVGLFVGMMLRATPTTPGSPVKEEAAVPAVISIF